MPKLLAAGHANLFAAPALPGYAMLQWAEAHEQLVVPQVGG